MRIEIRATCKPETLAGNLERDFEIVEIDGDSIVLEADEIGRLRKTPGVETIKNDGEEIEGIGGKPVDKEAYAKLESKEDAVKALLATIEGYNLRILNTDRQWDYRHLKKYNPDIKHLKFDEPRDFLEIDRSLFPSELEQVEIDFDRDKTGEIYREMLT